MAILRNELTFPETDIPPNSEASIKVCPKAPFRASSLRIPSDIDVSLFINDIRIGENSQLCIPVPAGLFRHQQMGDYFETCGPAIEITLMVRNISKEIVRFNATMHGFIIV